MRYDKVHPPHRLLIVANGALRARDDSTESVGLSARVSYDKEKNTTLQGTSIHIHELIRSTAFTLIEAKDCN